MIIDETIIVDAIISAVETMCVLLICHKLARQPLPIRVKIIFIVLYMAFTLVCNVVNNNIILSLICKVILVFMLTFVADLSVANRVFVTMSFVLISLLVEYLVAVAIALLTGMEVRDWRSSSSIYALVSIIAKFMAYCTINVLSAYMSQRINGVLKLKNALVIMLLSSIVAIAALMAVSYYVHDNQIKLLTILATLVLIVGDIGALAIYQYGLSIGAKNERDICERHNIQQQKEELTRIISAQIISSREIHETKNTIFSIREMLLNNNERALDMINHLCNMYQDRELVEYIGISDVDVLLNVKEKMAKEHGKIIVYKINVQGVINMDSVQLCMVLGNMIDNAVLHSSSDKIIVVIKVKGNLLSISSYNKVQLSDSLNGRDKNTSLNHGFGIRRIADIAAKYDGDFTTLISDDEFCAMFFAVIPNPD